MLVLGSERVDEVFAPEKAITRALNYYKAKGYTNEWIEARMKSIFDRNNLTDLWAFRGIESQKEYALLTNEIYRTWSGMQTSEYKEYKGIRKESLRDNMTRIEVLLTDLGENAIHDIVEIEHPEGFKENMSVAKKVGNCTRCKKII